jgi:AcrR family transcriptional regulator
MVSSHTGNQLGAWRPDITVGRTRHRAAALPPAERRAAIIDATVPLLIAYGTTITTRQIAQAAGIAEGTIFRHFPDKGSLIAAAIDQAFDPAPVEAELRAIDLTMALEDRLKVAVGIIQRRVTYIWRLMTAVGMSKAPDDQSAIAARRSPTSLAALAALFEPDRERFRREPMAAAQLPGGGRSC